MESTNSLSLSVQGRQNEIKQHKNGREREREREEAVHEIKKYLGVFRERELRDLSISQGKKWALKHFFLSFLQRTL